MIRTFGVNILVQNNQMSSKPISVQLLAINHVGSSSKCFFILLFKGIFQMGQLTTNMRESFVSSSISQLWHIHPFHHVMSFDINFLHALVIIITV